MSLTTDMAGQALANPVDTGKGCKEALEGVGTAATGVGTGVGTAAEGVGTGVSTAAVGIGTGVEHSRMGHATCIEAQGKADAAVVAAEYAGKAQVIDAMAKLDGEAQKKLMDQGALNHSASTADVVPTVAGAVAQTTMAPWAARVLMSTANPTSRIR
jgi:hypothetical protein